MKYSTFHLYKINPKTFIGKPYEQVLQLRLKALGERRKELAQQLRKARPTNGNYDDLCAINYELMYLNSAEEDHIFLLEEMGITPQNRRGVENV